MTPLVESLTPSRSRPSTATASSSSRKAWCPRRRSRLLRERYLRLFEGELRDRRQAGRGELDPRARPGGSDTPDLQRLARRHGRRRTGALGADRAADGSAGPLPRRPPASGQRALETAGGEGDRLPPGRVLRRLPRPRRDDHLLDLARRPARRRRPRRVRARAHISGLGRRPSARSSMLRRTGWRRRGRRRRTAASSTWCRSSSRPAAARSITAARGTAHRRTRPPQRRAWRSSRTCSRSRCASTRRTSTSIYSRYKRRGDLSLDESFFPVLWDESGYRTPWLGAAFPPSVRSWAESTSPADRASRARGRLARRPHKTSLIPSSGPGWAHSEPPEGRPHTTCQ